MAAKYELKKTKTGFRFHLKAPNGKFLFSSLLHEDHATTVSALKLVQKYSGSEVQFEIVQKSKSNFHFVLRAPASEILAQSERYASLKGCRNGVQSSIAHGPTARLVDFTAEAQPKSQEHPGSRHARKPYR